MAGISNIFIKYNEVTYDGIDYCEIEITGTMTTADAGQYGIERHAVGCETPYTMASFFDCAANETTQFVTRDVINIEGAGADFHPTTGEVTDLYLTHPAHEQIGDAWRFTVGNCGDKKSSVPGFIYMCVAGGAMAIIIYRTLCYMEE